MRVLLDEDVPEQVIEVLRHVMPSHVVDHVHGIGWSGRPDVWVLKSAARRYELLVTNDHRQLEVPEETAALKKCGLHHVSYNQRVGGLKGLALACGAIIAAMPGIVEDLAAADGQRLVAIHGLDASKRYKITDPRRNPPKYWPR
jgi:hypothetical protein